MYTSLPIHRRVSSTKPRDPHSASSRGKVCGLQGICRVSMGWSGDNHSITQVINRGCSSVYQTQGPKDLQVQFIFPPPSQWVRICSDGAHWPHGQVHSSFASGPIVVGICICHARCCYNKATRASQLLHLRGERRFQALEFEARADGAWDLL